MPNLLVTCWHYLRAFIILYLCLFAGKGIAALLPIVIPGSIVGMLLLFVLLALNWIPAHWVMPGCTLLLRYMGLLFVPIAVGIMNYYQQIAEQFTPLIVSCLVSTLLVMAVVGFGTEYLQRRRADSTTDKEP